MKTMMQIFNLKQSSIYSDFIWLQFHMGINKSLKYEIDFSEMKEVISTEQSLVSIGCGILENLLFSVECPQGIGPGFTTDYRFIDSANSSNNSLTI